MRDAVTSRIKRVRRLALLAAHHSQDDWDYVHQLRVAARRAVVTLNALDGYATPHERRRIRRGLKRLRHIAGNARDLDVRLEQLLSESEGLSPSTRHGLVHAVVMERGQVQIALGAGVKKLRRKHRFRQWAQWADELEWQGASPEPTCHERAVICLAESVDRLEGLGHPWPAEPATLHQLRMIGKRTRYECELFASFFAADRFDTVYGQLLELQDDLGGWHDRQIAWNEWRRWSEHPPRRCAGPEVTAALRRAAESERAARALCEEKWSDGRMTTLVQQLREFLL